MLIKVLNVKGIEIVRFQVVSVKMTDNDLLIYEGKAIRFPIICLSEPQEEPSDCDSVGVSHQ